MLDQSATVAATLARHAVAVQESLRTLDLAAVERVARRLEAARLRGSTIYVAGNGGSAATAGHWSTTSARPRCTPTSGGSGRCA